LTLIHPSAQRSSGVAEKSSALRSDAEQATTSKQRQMRLSLQTQMAESRCPC
jgi:hypothetical protein